jgi:hypothetical protein
VVASHTDCRGLADVDGQLGLLPEDWLVCTAEFTIGHYILAHVDIARRMERHDGCGRRGMLGMRDWASLRSREPEGRKSPCSQRK